MIFHLTVLLCFQLAGEVLSRALDLPLPGPVLGMALMLAAFIALPRLAEAVRAIAQGLLAHLSLLFVPAGVGVVGHLDKLGADGLPVVVAIIASTVVSIVVGVWAFVGVSHMLGPRDA